MRMKPEPLPRARARPGPRRRPRPRWFSATARRFGLVLISAALVIGSWWAWHSGWAGGKLALLGRNLIQLGAVSGLRLENVLVEGRIETRPADLLAAMRTSRGMPLLAIDAAATKARLEALPWVLSATVERDWPSTLRVVITERKAFALWQHGKRTALIDRTGKVIVEGNLARAAGQPLVVGEGADRGAAQIVDILLSEPDLFRQVEAAVLVSKRRWNVRLVNGIDVRLPEEGTAAAWHRLAAMARSQGLLDRALTVIDMRLPDRVTVRLAPGATTTPESGDQST